MHGTDYLINLFILGTIKECDAANEVTSPLTRGLEFKS